MKPTKIIHVRLAGSSSMNLGLAAKGAQHDGLAMQATHHSTLHFSFINLAVYSNASLMTVV
jgi:hypothetical protein